MITALAVFVGSAALVTVTVSVSTACGAVNKPVVAIVPVPCVTAQLTAVFEEPETIAENCSVHLSGIDMEFGEMLTDTVGAEVTLTVATADLVGSAALTAETLYVPGELGAVYIPAALMVPPDAAHVTAVLLVPETIAVNCCCEFATRLLLLGVTEIDTTVGDVTLTCADADTFASAALVAVTL